MPRSYGSTNAQVYAAAPTVGPDGSLYYDSVLDKLFVSNGTIWGEVGSGAGGATEVYAQAAAPGAGSTALVWVDTDDTSTPVAFQMWTGSQAAYTALGTYDPMTLYVVTD